MEITRRLQTIRLIIIYISIVKLSSSVSESKTIINIKRNINEDDDAVSRNTKTIDDAAGNDYSNKSIVYERLVLIQPPLKGKHRQPIDLEAPKRLKINLNKNLFKNVSHLRLHKKNSVLRNALQTATIQGIAAMVDLYEKREPEMYEKGAYLEPNNPAAQLSLFSAPLNGTENNAKAAYAALVAAKKLKESIKFDFSGLGRQAPPRISLKRTPLEGLCPPRDSPKCLPATRRYRTHDGTCNNSRKQRWGSAQMPFHRFLAPEYSDGIENIRGSVAGVSLPSARFVSLVVHGSRDEDAPVTMMLPQWGQFLDHDLTSTAQPRSINGSVPSCCRATTDLHPSCLPIKVPRDDPWLSPLGVRCLEFLRSAPSQRRDCILSWREQTNQATSFIDASSVYSSNPRLSDNSRIFRGGLLFFGRGQPREDVCLRGALAHQCIKPGDTRSGEQPGLLAMHTVWVGEHNRIATELGELNPHWSDEKLYQEARRIIGAMFQHITFREFLPPVLGKDVCRLFDLELEREGYYGRYDSTVNPSIANAFSAAAFRFGHSLIQGSMMRADSNNRFINNNVSLHEEPERGDMGGSGSLDRLIRGLLLQRALKRDEFITPELTNHLFQSGPFPFGLDLAAINIQRGRDHGLPPYTSWRQPCGLTTIRSWEDLETILGPRSTQKLRQAYRHFDDVDLFVAGLAERPVVGGLVGPTFACIIAQQFSNLRKGDKFWYENPGFESSFTPAQLESIRHISLSQVLCRALGGGTIQPHAFLPADSLRNEREICGHGALAPIDLTAWKERDPFEISETNLPNFQSSFINQRPTATFSSPRPHLATASTNILNNVEFMPNGFVGIQPQLSPFLPQTQTQTSVPLVTPGIISSTETVNNKLDFKATTTKKPKKKTTTTNPSTIDTKLDVTTKRTKNTKRPTRAPTSSSVITNNKLDFANGQVIINNKLSLKPNSTTVNNKLKTKTKKRKTNATKNNVTRTKQKVSSNRRNDDYSETDFDETDHVGEIFVNNDYYYSDRNGSLPIQTNRLTNRINFGYGNVNEDNIFRPPTMTTKTTLTVQNRYRPQVLTNRPIAFNNNVPTYSNQQPPHLGFTYNNKRPTVSPEFLNKFASQFNHEDPTDTDENEKEKKEEVYSPSPSTETYHKYTTRRQDLHTFFLVETTKHTTTPMDSENYSTTTARPTLTKFKPEPSTYELPYFLENVPSSTPKEHADYYYPYLSQSYTNPKINANNAYYSKNYNSLNTHKMNISFTGNDFTGITIISKSKPNDLTAISSIDYDYTNKAMLPTADDYDNDDINDNNNEDHDYVDDEFDGYLRPEQNKFEPLRHETDKTYYRDYAKYNEQDKKDKVTNGSYNYPLVNGLGLYKINDENKTKELLENATEGLTNKRYAEFYTDKKTGLSDDKMDDFVSYLREQNKEDDRSSSEKSSDSDKPMPAEMRAIGKDTKASSIPPIVPFVLLTKPERPDNWVIFNSIKKRVPLPDVPPLDQESTTSEIPQPMFKKNSVKLRNGNAF